MSSDVFIVFKASTLIKQLGSYEQQHSVLHALKELDKILKTEYLLQYMDDVSLKQVIQKQLNKGENANKFARAVSWGNSGEIKLLQKPNSFWQMFAGG